MLFRRSPHLLALAITALLFVTAALYGRYNFYRDPGSVFFDPSRALERTYSALREREALAFRDLAKEKIEASEKVADFAKAGKDVFMCGVFVTMGREMSGGIHPLEVGTMSFM